MPRTSTTDSSSSQLQKRTRTIWLGVSVALSALLLLPVLAFAKSVTPADPLPTESPYPIVNPQIEQLISDDNPDRVIDLRIEQLISGDDPDQIIDPRIEQLISGDNPDQVIDIIIYLDGEANLEDLDLPPGKIARRNAVVEALKDFTEKSQQQFHSQLDALTTSGAILSYRVLWIVNAVQVSAPASSVLALADQPGIEKIVLDEPILFLDDENPTPAVLSDQLTWGLERVRVGEVWDVFGIDGTSVTVAIMDSGVDWSHLDLLKNYRGYVESAEPNHIDNWFDAVHGVVEPFDPHGHGTHVAGTAVGENGIGMAPGAQWMAVRVLDEFGLGTIGDIHAGFQWILAPNGDPALGPDIVNNSWGSSSNIPDLYPDVVALQSAGIIPIFSAGNSGPGEGSLHSPASYTDTLAVGASDDIDAVTWFSSRGPSEFTNQPKPAFVAPGAYVLSAKSGGGYEYREGTSMAAPHVAGLYALLLSADDSLDEPKITTILTSTAVVLDHPVPSFDSGWGRIDAYEAVAAVMPVGILRGQVKDGVTPVPAAIIEMSTPGGEQLDIVSDSSGYYEISLPAGLYNVGVQLFGFESYAFGPFPVTTYQSTILDVHLIAKPSGTISGSVVDSVTGDPLLAIINVHGTPVSVITNGQGHYQLALPSNSYTITASSIGHFLGNANVDVISLTSVKQDFALDTAPRTLLVDSGQWYYRSQIEFYSDALDRLDLSYNAISIRNPFEDVPSIEILSEYDVVIWSSPKDSPTQISAGKVISDYLGQGGNLIISGQNIAEYDDLLLFSRSWWSHHFQADHAAKVPPPISVAGHVDSVFDPAEISLNEPGSAQNQEATDSVIVHPLAFSEPAFQYPDGSIAGLQAGSCAPFEAVYLGFGLEGISSLEKRTDIISRSLDYFARPDRELGVEMTADIMPYLVAQGRRVTLTFDIVNHSELYTDTFTFRVKENDWPARVVSGSLTVGSCQLARITVTVDVPFGLPLDTVEEFNVTAISQLDSSVTSSVPVRLKTAGRLLLVDDDRWYNREDIYKSALEANGLNYDYWETGSFLTGRGSPPTHLLNEYDIIIWYTGYDWFAPVVDQEVESLEAYLNQGGRLFLSSQDYLDKNEETALTRDYFGINSFRESVTTTHVFGSDSLAFPEVITQPVTLNFPPYQNFSDGLILNGDSQSTLWNDSGYPGGVTNSRDSWKTVFWAAPFEVLPEEIHNVMMNRIVGWLGNLGQSTFEVDARNVPGSSGTDPVRTYTITLQALEGSYSTGVWITNTIPARLTIIPGSIIGGANYDSTKRQITWQGQIDGGQSQLILYQAQVDTNAADGTLIANPVKIYYDQHDLLYERVSPLWIAPGDLSETELELDPQSTQIGGEVAYQLEVGSSAVNPGSVTATVYVPFELSLITETVLSTGGDLLLKGNIITWTGAVDSGQSVTVTYGITAPLHHVRQEIPTLVVLRDGLTGILIRHENVNLIPHESFLPLFAKIE